MDPDPTVVAPRKLLPSGYASPKVQGGGESLRRSGRGLNFIPAMGVGTHHLEDHPN